MVGRLEVRWALAVLALLVAGCADDDDEPARALGDGTHFGFVTDLDPARGRLVFDPAELLADDDAGPVVRNPAADTHELPLDEDLVVRLLASGDACCDLREVTFEDWLAGFVPDERTFYGTADSHYELTIAAGRVVAVDEVHIS